MKYLKTFNSFQSLNESISNSNFLFHGTSEKSGESILQGGFINPSKGGSGMMSPRPDMVYLSSTLDYSMHYTLGGNYKSIIDGMKWLKGSGDNGYLFMVDFKDIENKEMLPDEDGLGVLMALALGYKSFEVKEHFPKFKGLDSSVEDELNNIYENYINHDGYDNSYEYEDEDTAEMIYEDGSILSDALEMGEYDAYAYVGKEIGEHLSKNSINIIVNDYGSHVSVKGKVPITRAYKFDKNLSSKLNKDLSNFFELAERVK